MSIVHLIIFLTDLQVKLTVAIITIYVYYTPITCSKRHPSLMFLEHTTTRYWDLTQNYCHVKLFCCIQNKCQNFVKLYTGISDYIDLIHS